MPIRVFTARQMVRELRQRIGGKSLRATAKELGCTVQMISMVLAGDRAPGPAVAKALGYEQVTRYRKAK